MTYVLPTAVRAYPSYRGQALALTTDELYEETLRIMEESHASLAARVRQPQAVALRRGYVIRYVECDVHQALVQKLARVISGLHASRLLMGSGFFQEQCALQRTLDEFNDDILFLAYSVISGETTDLHREYLAAFYQEEFDDPLSAIESSQRRPMVSRQKIRAYLSRINGPGLDPSSSIEVGRTIQKLYSGFVHGASPQIMEMYYGNPSHFHVRGMVGAPRAGDHREDLWNYFYRSICSFAFTAKAFGDDGLYQSVAAYMKTFARAHGEDYSKRPPRLRH